MQVKTTFVCCSFYSSNLKYDLTFQREPEPDWNRIKMIRQAPPCSPEVRVFVCAGEPRGRLERVWADCAADPAVYQLVLAWQDGSLMSLTPRGNVMFVREEGLAHIHTAQMVVRTVQEDNQAGGGGGGRSSQCLGSELCNFEI